MAQLKSLSINGNNVADYIIDEQQSSSNVYNFKFRKWASGTLEVWYTLSKSVNYTKAWSDEIKYDEVTIKTPKELNVPSFITVDHMQQTLYGNTGGGLYSICPATGFSIESDGSFKSINYVISFTTTEQSNKNIGISNYIIGTWKEAV